MTLDNWLKPQFLNLQNGDNFRWFGRIKWVDPWKVLGFTINMRCDYDVHCYKHLPQNVFVYKLVSLPQTWQVPCDNYFCHPNVWAIVESPKISVAFMLVEWLKRVWGISSPTSSFPLGCCPDSRRPPILQTLPTLEPIRQSGKLTIHCLPGLVTSTTHVFVYHFIPSVGIYWVAIIPGTVLGLRIRQWTEHVRSLFLLLCHSLEGRQMINDKSINKPENRRWRGMPWGVKG